MSTFGVFDRTGDRQVRDTLLGNGNSAAQAQLARGQRQIANQAYSTAAGQRGGNPALAYRNAQTTAAAAGAEGNLQAAQLRAQEQAQAEQVAQQNDAKRGQLIGGVLGGIGAGVGTLLGGPAGAAIGGAAGKLAGNAAGGTPVDAGALGRTLLGGAAGAAMAPAAYTPQQPIADGDVAGKQAALAQQAPPLTIAEETRQPIMPATDPVAPAYQATAPLQGNMLPATADPRGQASGAVVPPTPMQQVAVNNAPIAEGAPLAPQGPAPVAQPQLAQTLPSAQPINLNVPAPAAPPVGPQPVYSYQAPQGGFGVRNGSGGTAPQRISSPEELDAWQRTIAKFGGR